MCLSPSLSLPLPLPFSLSPLSLCLCAQLSTLSCRQSGSSTEKKKKKQQRQKRPLLWLMLCPALEIGSAFACESLQCEAQSESNYKSVSVCPSGCSPLSPSLPPSHSLLLSLSLQSSTAASLGQQLAALVEFNDRWRQCLSACPLPPSPLYLYLPPDSRTLHQSVAVSVAVSALPLALPLALV